VKQQIKQFSNKILIYEEEPSVRNKIIHTLTAKGYFPEKVETVTDILLILKNDIPCLLILDLSGSEILSFLEKNDLSNELPILFLCKELDLINSKEFPERVTDTIHKPIRAKELLYRVKKLINLNQTFHDLRKEKLELEIDMKVQRLIESELLEKENRLATILDSVEAFIYIKDTHYRYQYANKKVRNLFRQSLEDIINKEDFYFFDTKTATNLRKIDQRIIDHGERIEEEQIINGKKGMIAKAFLSIKLPLFREDGTVYALSGISTEITKHKQAEDKLKRALAQLEEQHTQLKSTQAQLVQAEKMAGLGTLVAGVAHEVNNPTNYIFLSSKALERDLVSFRKEVIQLMVGSESEVIKYFEDNFNKFQRSLSNIIEGGERIRMIVQDLRSFSRLDEAEKKHASIYEILDSTLRIVKIQYKKEININMASFVDESIECYPAQLGQVFLNVLINSCQAILQKKKDYKEVFNGRIKISVQRSESSIEVIIEDNGCGMSDDVRTKIFEPFFTTKLVGQGTGLGMSISYGIIQKHNGQIRVESELNVGTKITISLPLGGI